MRCGVVALLVLFVAQAAPAADAVDGETLVESARRLELAEHPTWQALLHFRPRWFGLRRRSELPESEFFLAAGGRSDAGAELEATLRALLAPESEGDDAVHCRFPARARWLGEQLGLAPERLAAAPCPTLDEWLEGLSPRGITMIFPEAFMNNAASMFGHTLLRLDVADPKAPQNLLAYAIDFTAQDPGDAGPVYLVKGSFGFYPGYFGLNPFYQKLAFYADWQNRDIWEYPLDLTQDEIALILRHLFELDEVAIPYFFFRENCSYQLLRLLAVARPDIRLGHGFPYGVIPIDTVRDALDEVGLLGEVRYRASPAASLRFALDALSSGDKELALALARGELEPDDARVATLPPGERAAVLNAAYEAHRYTYLSEEGDETEARERSYALLVARSRAAPGAPPAVPEPEARPDEGHGTALVAFAGGVEDGDSFLELRVRPAFHGLLEPEAGFPGDSTIRFLDTRIRWFPSQDRVRLQELVFVDLQSNTPRDDFFEPLSWGMGTGLYTRLFPDDGDLDRSLVWRAAGSVGLTWEPWERWKLYGLLDGRVEAGSGFDGGWALGPGLELGLELGTPSDRWKGRLFGRGTQFVAGDRGSDAELGLAQRLTLTGRTAAVAEVGWHYYDHESWLDARLSLQWTF